MAAELIFKGEIEAQPKTALAPGNWYIGFTCRSCERGVAFLEDPTGTGRIVVGGDAMFQLTCPSCANRNAYMSNALRVFQSPTGGMTTAEETVI